MTHENPIEGHSYDGIQELDNPLPRWWVYLFIGTIIFAVGYCGYYWFGGGLTAVEVLNQSNQKKEAPSGSPNKGLALADAVKNPATIADGRAVYTSKCAACHAADGGGLIGPNLTDNYWIHGSGRLEDIDHVVRIGVTEKGMLAWEKTLKEDELVAVVAYVKTLGGTTPASPKAPEGNQVTQ